MQLPGKIWPHLVFQPAQPGAKEFAVSHYLGRFGEVYLKSPQLPTVNLLRKMYHAQLKRMRRDEPAELKRIFQRVFAHCEEVGENTYAVQTPEDDVKLSAKLVAAIVGDTVPWPAAAVLEGRHLPHFAEAEAVYPPPAEPEADDGSDNGEEFPLVLFDGSTNGA